MTESDSILIIVHPGSACGSADFNLGAAAAEARHALAHEIRRWTGHVMIVDGELSSDLDVYPQIGLAIENAIDDAASRGRRASRVLACDFTREEWPRIAAEHFAERHPGSNDVVLTGAWVEPDGGGCVPAMAGALAAQRSVTISPSALSLP